MIENEAFIEKAILVGVHRGLLDPLADTTEESMEELRLLAKTAGAEVLCQIVQNKSDLETYAYVGEGKLEEIRLAAEETGANLLIFDDELTGSQLRNIENATGVRVIDRSMLILDIFAGRAISAEGKIQVELAQLRYTLPRLTGQGIALSRQGAGIATRGPGETKLETDRRHIHRRIHALEEDLKSIEKHRKLLRERRKKEDTAIAALVGYTNAGKSTLMNRLTDADCLAENMLFATLDPTVRALDLPDGRNAILIDTVGFIRKLPHHLIEAFRSTLEEAVLADVLVHVIDASHPDAARQISVVERLLSDLGCGDKPVIAVYNKADLLPEGTPRIPVNADSYVFTSAKEGTGLSELRAALHELLPGKKKQYTLLIPYSEGALLGALHETEEILSEEFLPEGTRVTLYAAPSWKEKIAPYII